MKSVLTWLEKGIFFIGVLLFGGILALDILMENTKYFCKNSVAIPNGLLILAGILLTGVLVFLWRKYEDKIAKILQKGEKRMLLLSVILFVVELVISCEILFAPGWDAGEVSWQAGVIAAGERKLDNQYFSWYPNNLLITWLYSLACRITGLFGFPYSGSVIIVVVQCFLSALGGYLLQQVAKNMFQSGTVSMIVWGIYAFWIGLLPWYMVTYSDSLGIIFPIAILWLYQSLENKKAVWQKCMLIGVLSLVGYRIKPTILILYISIVIVMVLRLGEKHERRFRLGQLCVLLLAFILSMFLYQKINIGACLGFSLDKDQQFTMTHFAMMGLSEETNGVFDEEDVKYSSFFRDISSRQKGNIKVIRQRIQEYGALDLSRHLVKKTLTNFNDGTFGWGKEAEFFKKIERPEEVLSKFLKNLYYNGGMYRISLNTYMQCFWLMMLLGGFLNLTIVFRKEKVHELSLMIMLSLTGLFLFVTLFEARARYLYVYTPFYILIGIQGYRQVLVDWHVNNQENSIG